MPILDVKNETLNRRDMEQLQLERLQSTLNRVIRNVAFYQKWFRDAGLLPADFRSLADIRKLPVINRKTLVENHPYGMFAVPLRDVIRMHPSTLGMAEPVVIGYTQNDITNWTRLKARGFMAANFSHNDMVQIYLDYTQFPGAVIAHYGAEQLGACVTPLFNIQVSDQIEIMKNYRTTVLICTQSRAIHLMQYIRKNNIDIKSLFLRTIILAGEPWSDHTRQVVAEELQVEIFGYYGVMEICSPGIAFECDKQNGLHINEDYFLPEIINPESGEILPSGQKGELVLTTLNKEAFPLIRYRTGDITVLHEEPCACGRTLIRMENVSSRTDDLLVVEGVEFHPAEIGVLLEGLGLPDAQYRLLILREETRDRLELDLAIPPDLFKDLVVSMEALRTKIADTIYERLNLVCFIHLVNPASLEGKERVSDQRNHV